ncbi:hypothetical protein PTKIN_Ptkin12aG0064400 [Pterospermum kingtungense]
MLEELFCKRDVKEISSILLSGINGRDRRIWSFTKDGNYSVKSGYYVALQVLMDFAIPGDWLKLWNLKISPKIESFLWRIARDCLPTRTHLQA